MDSSARGNSDNRKWKKLKAQGKGNYLLSQVRLGILTGICFGIILHITESGFDLLNLDFARRLFIGGTVFSISSYLQALLIWRRFEKNHPR